MLKTLDKVPFPWFGGKTDAAPLVWRLLGDCPHYCEPFFGGGAVLLRRPHPCNRAYHSETINDLDGFVVNFWRAVQWAPELVASAASWPVSEADKQARQLALLRWRDESLDRLAGDATWYCPVMAGWWAYSLACQIGTFDGKSGWTADPETGQIYLQPRGKTREPGVARNRPHINDGGHGVNRPQTREPGVSRKLPHLSHDGCGVNRPQLREPGVFRDRPHISDCGQGVNHPGTREPGVVRDRPHISDCGQGVNHPGTREPGVLDPITPDHGVSALDTIDWGASYHDLVMPELIRWLRHLSARLRHVRILNGDWARLCTKGALYYLPVRQGKGPAGVFLDPPYADTAGRDATLYASESLTVAHDVREWCLANGDDPKLRIVLAGYDGEHGTALTESGWSEHEWFKAGHLKGGMGNTKRDGTGSSSQQKRERLWASPHCLPLTTAEPERMLF